MGSKRIRSSDYVRTPEEIEREIQKFEAELEKLSDGDPNVGHIATILVGLRGELLEAQGGIIF